MKFIISVMASGFTVTQEASYPGPLLADQLQKAVQAGQCHVQDAAAYGMAGGMRAATPTPTKPLAHAFSTLAEVERYVRDQLGYDQQATDGMAASVGNTLASDGPDEDWVARDRRQTALNYAVCTGKHWSPDDVLRAAEQYEQYLRGATVPTPADANDKQEG